MKLAFLGDLCVGDDIPRISEGLRRHLAGHDIRCVNLEGPLIGDGVPFRKAGPHLSNSLESVDLMKSALINLICTANNHIMDWGEIRARKTIENAGIPSWGLQIPGFSSAVVRFSDEQGQSVSLISGTESFHGAIGDSDPIDAVGTISITSRRFQTLLCAELKENDIVIVVAHCGLESVKFPLPEWREFFRSLIDLGARAVIAHHSHVIQPWEVYKGAPIFYSIGNFCVDKRYNGSSNSGLCVSIEIGANKSISFKFGEVEISDDQKQVQLLRSTVSQNQADLDVASETIDKLCTAIYENSIVPMLHDTLNAFGHRPTWKDVISIMRTRLARRYIDSSDVAQLQRTLILEHLFRVESNRWVIQRALRRKSIQ